MRTVTLIALAALLLTAPASGQGKKVDCKALGLAVSKFQSETIVYTASKLRLSIEFEELTVAAIRRIFARFSSRSPDPQMDPSWLTDQAFAMKAAARAVLETAGCPAEQSPSSRPPAAPSVPSTQRALRDDEPCDREGRQRILTDVSLAWAERCFGKWKMVSEHRTPQGLDQVFELESGAATIRLRDGSVYSWEFK